LPYAFGTNSMSPMTIDEYEELLPEEQEHFARCSTCGEIFDRRSLMSRAKAAAVLSLAAGTVLAGSAAIGNEDVDLRDLDVAGWDCANQFDGTAQSQDAKERNRMKNRWPPGDPSVFPVDALDTAAFRKRLGNTIPTFKANAGAS
jgi:hypothetical protein